MNAQQIFAVFHLALFVSVFGIRQFELAGESTKTITINACCKDSDGTADIKRELKAMKDLLNSLLNGSDCCCGHTNSATRVTSPAVTQRAATTKPAIFPDCYIAHWYGETTSGIYTVQPDPGYEPFDVYCDMDTDGGGWTVLQRRVNGTVDFFRDWSDYENGFGSLTGEFWLGNKKLYHLTYQYTQRLRVELTDFEDETRFAVYDSFSVSNASEKYRLNLRFRSSSAGDALGYHDGAQFSTRDQDNDNSTDVDCAKHYKGGWWYQACQEANLNGLYPGLDPSSDADGIEGLRWGGYKNTLRFTEMKLRPQPWND